MDRLQEALGLGLKDIALLAGGLTFVLSILLLGVSGSSRPKRWMGRFGWLALLAAVIALGYGTINRDHPTAASLASQTA